MATQAIKEPTGELRGVRAGIPPRRLRQDTALKGGGEVLELACVRVGSSGGEKAIHPPEVLELDPVEL